METAEAYGLLRERIIDLAVAADPSTPVPACPGWTIRELLAHLAGVAADVVGGNLAGAGTDPWVAAQLHARSSRTVEEIAEEWRTTGPQVDEVCAALGDAVAQLIFDTVTHEQDIREAVAQPGAVHGAVEVGLRWAAGAWGDHDAPTDGTLRIRAGTVEAAQGSGDPVVAVELPPLEALAALTGRRTLAELRACAWDGDVEPWLPAFTWGPFEPAAE